MGYEAGPASSCCSARDPCRGPYLCHHTRPPWVAGPTAGRFPYPGLPWKSSVPAAENFCRTILLHCGRGRGLPGPWLPWHCPGKFGRGKPLPYAHQSKKCGNFQGLFVSSPSRTALTRHPVPRGGFHKAGEGPAFGGLWFLSGSRKEPPAGSVPTRLASLRLGTYQDTWPIAQQQQIERSCTPWRNSPP